ncbi:MAG: DUF3418 domain-containing protein, partial [Gammaproteobacteria bacterium]|nr:DUF3418 domain-containing protein [Gammaproteobacteria bacterium]
EALTIKNQTLRLGYVFEPGDEADGVSVFLPIAVLNQFEDADFDFLVPGLLQDKVQALIKSLPKQLRKNFIPVSEFALACVEALNPDKSLCRQLCEQLQRMTGVKVPEDAWRTDRIDQHFLMRYCLQQNGVTVASSRSLSGLKEQYASVANQQFEQQIQQADSISREGILCWDFERLPEQTGLTQKGGSVITAYPALVDYQDSVAIELFETRQDAQFYHAGGIARLIAFELRDSIRYLRKNLPDIEHSALMYVSLGSREELTGDIIMASIAECFLRDGLPADKREFDAVIGDHRPQFIATANAMAERVHKILQLYYQVRDRLQNTTLGQDHLDDCREQCEYLVYEGFVRDIPPDHLVRLPVYLQAILKRLDKTELDPKQANRALPLIVELWQQYLELEDGERGTNEQLQQLRWMIEEFRISCFAQPMKTRGPVSENKIRKLIDMIR